MKKIITSISVSAIGLCMLAAANLASAHAHYTYLINGKTYNFVVGSLNEPLIVDDKSGLDLTVTQGGGMPTMGPDGDMDGPPAAAAPVSGLDKTLKVEMSAGGQKKVFDLAPAYGKPGGYTTTFFPTVPTTFTYRLFGTLSNVPIDLSFTCSPAGNAQTPDDTAAIKISDKVTQTLKSGVFGCAEAKSDYGFPETAASNYELQQANAAVTDRAGSSNTLGIAGIVLGALGLIVSGISMARVRNSRS